MIVTMILGAPASGKSTAASKLKNNSVILNRDTEGGKIIDLIPKLESLLIKNTSDVLLDNLFPDIKTRKLFIDLCKKYKVPINCIWVKTSIEDCQFNAVIREIKLTNEFPSPEIIKKSKHPNIFPPAVLFKYKKDFEPPSIEEGFDSLKIEEFSRENNPNFTNKALILDYDGCLRECVGGNGKYPTEKNQIKIKENVTETLSRYKNNGYRLLGISNQSGIHKKELSLDKAKELFDYTNSLIGLDIEYAFCPHQSAPISCYCRKPQTGLFINFMLKYNLDRKQCIFVGDMTSDKTAATRFGCKYIDQLDFFK